MRDAQGGWNARYIITRLPSCFLRATSGSGSSSSNCLLRLYYDYYTTGQPPRRQIAIYDVYDGRFDDVMHLRRCVADTGLNGPGGAARFVLINTYLQVRSFTDRYVVMYCSRCLCVFER